MHSWAGNVPGLPLWSLVCGLLVKAGNIGKLPSAEPLFASLFARLLAEVHPPLADCLAVVWWKGGDEAPSAALYAQADTVLAYGGNEAIDQIRRQVPITTRFLPYGHKLGLGLIGRDALDAQRAPATARLAAHDVVRYDQQGCYSPHVFYVERGGKVAPREFAQYLASELANLERRFPRRALALEDSGGRRRLAPVGGTARPGRERRRADRRRRRRLGRGLCRRGAAAGADRGPSQHPGGRRGPPRRSDRADRAAPRLPADRGPGRRVLPSCSASPNCWAAPA